MASPLNPIILVVDDSASVAKTLAMLIEQAGYNAIFVTSGIEALQVVEGVAVNIAILDIQLPGIDGLQTAVEIRKKLPHCKIILISGQPESMQQLEWAAKQGLQFPVLAKPIPPRELFATIKSLWSTPLNIRGIQEARPRSRMLTARTQTAPAPPGFCSDFATCGHDINHRNIWRAGFGSLCLLSRHCVDPQFGCP